MKIGDCGVFEIFINPSQSEIVKIASKGTNRIRFTADARSQDKRYTSMTHRGQKKEIHLPVVGIPLGPAYSSGS